jgi:hypothetical protein
MSATTYLQPPVLAGSVLRSLGRGLSRLRSAVDLARSPRAASQETETDAMIAAARSAFGPLEIRIEAGRVRYAAASGAEALLGDG